MQELAVNLFLEENQWVSDAVIIKSGADNVDVQIHIDIAPNGHDLIRDHGMQKFEREIQAKLSSIDYQGICWKVCSVREEVWGQFDPELKQTFPRVLSRVEDFPNNRLLIDVSPDLSCFQGHFPDKPILAGVTQLHWAACVSCKLYGFDEVPKEVKRLKFRNVVSPPRVLELALSRIFEDEVQFEFASLGQVHSQGRLVFDEAISC